MSNLVEIQPEYVYMTIPREYVCVYHRILAMLADYGEDMLKDCKASCTDKNSGAIECFNMFNSAVAARKLGKTSEADTIIKYVKAKINQIYHNVDNSTEFVFPVDENGELKAFVSCNETTKFYINSDDMELYKKKFGDGNNLDIRLGEEDYSPRYVATQPIVTPDSLIVTIAPTLSTGNIIQPNITILYNGVRIDPSVCTITYVLDNAIVEDFDKIAITSTGKHTLEVTVSYNNKIATTALEVTFTPNNNSGTGGGTVKIKKVKVDMNKYIYYRSIKNTSPEKEVYRTNTINLTGDVNDVFYIPVNYGMIDNSIPEEIIGDADVETVIIENKNYLRVVFTTPGTMLFVCNSYDKSYLIRKGNKFEKANNSIISTRKNIVMPTPNKSLIFELLFENREEHPYNFYNYELQVRKTSKRYRNIDNKTDDYTYHRWKTVSCIDDVKPWRVFRIRIKTRKGYRSDWAYFRVGKYNMFNDSFITMV